MKKIIIATLILLLCFLSLNFAVADQNLAQKLSGQILLQVQSHGEAWYVNPVDLKKYYLGRPANAFDLMHNLSIGITSKNLAKFPIGLIEYDDQDDDNDGLNNRLEQALGTDPQKQDSDNDGYNDKLEIENNHDPLSAGSLPIDENFITKHLGKIFLQIEAKGESWYINPADQKRYYLGRPADAFFIMKNLSLGITNTNLNQITTGYLASPPVPPTPPACPNCQTSSASQAISGAASAIRSGNTSQAVSYFIPEMQKAIEYTMNFLDAEGKLILGNIISGTSLSQSNDNEKIYSTEVYFSLGGYKVSVHFHVQKQENGTWLLANL